MLRADIDKLLEEIRVARDKKANPKEAIRIAHYALSMWAWQQDRVPFLLELGNLYLEIGEVQKAIEKFREVIERTEKFQKSSWTKEPYNDLLRADALRKLGCLVLKTDIDKSTECLNQALEICRVYARDEEFQKKTHFIREQEGFRQVETSCWASIR